MGIETFKVAASHSTGSTASTSTAMKNYDISFERPSYAKHSNFVGDIARATTNTQEPIPEHSISAYLKGEIGTVLGKCLKDVAELRPKDPINFIAKWLYKYRDNYMYLHENMMLTQTINKVVRITRREQHTRQHQHKIIKEEIIKVEQAFLASRDEEETGDLDLDLDLKGVSDVLNYQARLMADNVKEAIRRHNNKTNDARKKEETRHTTRNKRNISKHTSQANIEERSQRKDWINVYPKISGLEESESQGHKDRRSFQERLASLTSHMSSRSTIPYLEAPSVSRLNSTVMAPEPLTSSRPTSSVFGDSDRNSLAGTQMQFSLPITNSFRKTTIDSDGEEVSYGGQLPRSMSGRQSVSRKQSEVQGIQLRKKSSLKNKVDDIMYVCNTVGELVAVCTPSKKNSFRKTTVDSDGEKVSYVCNAKAELLGIQLPGLTPKSQSVTRKQSEKANSQSVSRKQSETYGIQSEMPIKYLEMPIKSLELPMNQPEMPMNQPEMSGPEKGNTDSHTTLTLANFGKSVITTTDDTTLGGHTLNRSSVFGGRVFEVTEQFKPGEECNDDKSNRHNILSTQSHGTYLQRRQSDQEIIKPQEQSTWRSRSIHSSDTSIDSSDIFDESIKPVKTNSQTEGKIDDHIVESDGEVVQVCEGTWMFDMGRFSLMCQHPLLGQLRHPYPPELTHIETPLTWQEKDFKACVHYDPELFTHSTKDTDSLLWITHRISFQESTDSQCRSLVSLEGVAITKHVT